MVEFTGYFIATALVACALTEILYFDLNPIPPSSSDTDELPSCSINPLEHSAFCWKEGYVGRVGFIRDTVFIFHSGTYSSFKRIL